MNSTNEYLDRLLESGFKALSSTAEPNSLYEPVRYTMAQGGKRFRPRLVLIASGLCGEDPSGAVPAAVAVEMLHNFTLIHDDIMDQADTRRGEPTVFRKWNESTAILSGDVLFVMALRTLIGHDGKNSFPGNIKDRLMHCLLEATQTVCEGQAMDMDFEKRADVRLGEYIGMIHAKTAALIRCSMQMGAIVAGADSDAENNCADIGEHTGIAFQIQDDLLDATGDTGKFGKRVGGDIIQGKKTYLSILATERADDAGRRMLAETLGNRQAGDGAISEVIRCYHDLGVIEDAASEIERNYQIALEKLGIFEDSEYRHEIKVLLDKLKIRDQ
ncbi:polyprenyl synthetase family protein [Balneolales bacterium ANBcel1]|nr:polyprenyl synthetase family protein [Balneolales bacterium ANBcel1]